MEGIWEDKKPKNLTENTDNNKSKENEAKIFNKFQVKNNSIEEIIETPVKKKEIKIINKIFNNNHNNNNNITRQQINSDKKPSSITVYNLSRSYSYLKTNNIKNKDLSKNQTSLTEIHKINVSHQSIPKINESSNINNFKSVNSFINKSNNIPDVFISLTKIRIY